MGIEEIGRRQLEELAEAGASVTVPASLLLALIVKIEKLEEEVAELKRNSRTSSKPPSSDRGNPNKPSMKGRRDRGRRNPGGQKGHKGKTLMRIGDPDRVIIHRLKGRCANCRGSLRGAEVGGHEARQVFDLPGEISVEVTEHRAETGICPCCGKRVRAAFPEGVAAPAQYGERLRAMVIYLHVYQLLPCERLGELFADVFGCPLSPGTVANFLRKAGARAGPVVERMKGRIRGEPFIHFDETGLSLSGGIHWLHTASTPRVTCLHVDRHRGLPAMEAMGVIADYGGHAIHDYLASYYRFGELSHGLCNAHHIRDLTCVHEEHGQKWASDMIALLLEAKALRERERGGGGGASARRLWNACRTATSRSSRPATRSIRSPCGAPARRGGSSAASLSTCSTASATARKR